MTYFEGFIAAVPKENRDAYLQHARDAAPILHEFGVSRHVEAWADDLPAGEVTDFRKAVAATDGEDVVFSWFEYPDKQTRDAVFQRMMSDPRMEEMTKSMPFDGKRMVFGGFEPIVESGAAGGSYVDGFVVPVPERNRDAYRQMAEKAAAIFHEHGALRDVEAIANDVPRGEVTDFYRAVQAEDGETVVFSFIEWPSKAARDEGWKKLMEDELMKPDGDMPFSGKRMFWGGFERILDSRAEAAADA
jgi:uncharacterized protein YbaA (DUF1428 family)